MIFVAMEKENIKYINKEELLKKLYEEDAITMKGVAIINNFPIENVKEVNTGIWLGIDGCMGVCSECGVLGCITKYCPNCGSYMKKRKR